MAVHFTTDAPQELLKAFDKRILQTEPNGKIVTWEKSADGVYYTHKAVDWRAKAWFKPAIKSQRLTFNIIKPKNDVVTPLVYAYYHGHLTETFLNHFDKMFGEGISTALATEGDIPG